MNWHYYIEEKPVFNQEICFIRQYTQGKQSVCEFAYGVMKKDGIHPYVTEKAYSTYPCDDRDISVWADRKELKHDLVRL